MAELSAFFKSIGGDRKYTSQAIARFFKGLVTSGILNGGLNLQVYATGTDNISRVRAGEAWIEGRHYENTSELPLTHDAADPVNNRIDRVVLRLDITDPARYIRLFIKKGIPGATPTPPALTRTTDVYELSLAQVTVPANTLVIPVENVYDERLDSNVCGLANSLIKVDTAVFQQEWDAFMATLVSQGYVAQSVFDEHKADYVKHPAFATATGTANTYAVTLDPAPNAYVDGMGIAVAINIDATGASTLNVNGLGAIPIKKANGTDVTNLKANGVYTVRYNSATGNFILQGEGGSGNAVPTDVRSGKTFTNDAGEQTGSLNDYSNNYGAFVGTSLHADTANQQIVLTPNGVTTGIFDTTTRFRHVDTDFVPQNIRSGVTIFGILGTLVEGKRSVTGSVISSSAASNFVHADGSTVSFYSAEVTGLTFQPSTALIWGAGSINNATILFPQNIRTNGRILWLPFNPSGLQSSTTTRLFRLDGVESFVTANSIRLPAANAGAQYSYIIIE